MLKILYPRLICLAILIALGLLARNPICRYTMEHYANSRLGLPVKMRETDLRLMDAALELRDVLVPDPLRPRETAMKIDSVTVKIDTADFLKRKYTIPHARLHGVHYLTSPEESRFFVTKDKWDRFKNRFPELFLLESEQQWIDLFSGKYNEQTQRKLNEQFESAKFVTDASEFWKGETKPLLEKTQAMSDRVKRLQRLFENPRQLQGADRIELITSLLQDAESLESDLKTLSGEIATLERAARDDALTLKRKLHADYETLKAMQPPKLNSRILSEILIGEDILQRFSSMLVWADSVHEFLETTNEGSPFLKLPRSRGRNVYFSSRKDLADCRMDVLDFDGDLFFEDEPLYFLGRVTNIVLPRNQGKKATVVQLCLDQKAFGEIRDQARFEEILDGTEPDSFFKGATETLDAPLGSTAKNNRGALGESLSSRIYVTALFDFSVSPPREKYVFLCPRFELPERVLGKEGEFAFHVSPGVSQICAEIDREGDSLQGRIRFLQFPIRLSPEVPQPWRGTTLEKSLLEAVAQIDHLDVRASFDGTLEEPGLHIESDFGQRFLGSVQPVLLHLWNEARQETARELNTMTNAFLAETGERFQSRLNPTLREIETVRTQLLGGDTRRSTEQAVRAFVLSLSNTNGQGERTPLNLSDTLDDLEKGRIPQSIKDGIFKELNERYGREVK